MINDFATAKETLNQFRETGIRLDLDDFGVGYSSLNYLQQLPIDCLKLDRSLISEIDQNLEQRRIVECVVRLGKVLGLCVIAEGIETVEQLQTVIDLGCDYGQGYLFAKPAPVDRVIEILIDELAGKGPMLDLVRTGAIVSRNKSDLCNVL